MSVFSLPSSRADHFGERAFRRSIVVSMILHAIVIAVAGGMTLFRTTGTVYAPTYTVDLVSLAPTPGAPGKGDGGAPGPPGPELKPAPKPAPAPAPAPVPAPAPKVTPKPEAKPPVPPAAPVKKPAAAPVEKPAPPPPQTVSKEVKPAGGDEAAALRLERKRRIEELEQEARQLYESYTGERRETEEAAPPTTAAGQEEGTGPVGVPSGSAGAGGTGEITGSGFGGGGGQTVNIRFRAYFDVLWSRIRSSWILPEGVATKDKLLTVVGIRIAPDGEILEYRIESGSGNAYYDQSAIRAIRKSSPLPPLPEELGNEPLEIGVNFRYPE